MNCLSMSLLITRCTGHDACARSFPLNPCYVSQEPERRVPSKPPNECARVADSATRESKSTRYPVRVRGRDNVSSRRQFCNLGEEGVG